MKKYKASVITAVGKLAHYQDFIERYYNNLINQTIFDELEVIVIYVEWHEHFEKWKTHSNIKFVLDDEGKGMYNAWNLGIKNATSEYVTNWNIDDLRFPSNIEQKVDILNNNKDIDLVYNWYTVTNDIKEDYNNFDTYRSRYVEAYPDEAQEYVYQACMCGPDPLWRKNVHEKIGYFDIEYPAIADWEMWIRMAFNGSKFKLLPEVLCLFYENPNSVSNRLAESREKVEKGKLYNQYEGFKSPKTTSWERVSIASSIKFSILIPSLNRRKKYLDRLMEIITPQLTDEVEVLFNIDDGEKSIGTKRNELIDKAKGDYIAFVDDDDIVEDCYVKEILKAIQQGPDVVGMHLLYKEDDILKGLTYHSLKYTHWWDEPHNQLNGIRNYYRNPNHLNPVRREYALATKFPEINFAEDKDYSYRILKYLNTEVYIERPIYEYLYRSKKEC